MTIHGRRVAGDRTIHRFDVTLQRLEEPGPLQGLIMIAFTEVAEPVVARDGRRFRVRVRPCRTGEGRMDGVVITFADLIPGRPGRAPGQAARAGPPPNFHP